jgi:hypothetical protein
MQCLLYIGLVDITFGREKLRMLFLGLFILRRNRTS